MVTAVQSFSDPATTYTVVIDRGVVVNCACGHHQYRGAICKHMTGTQVEINAQKADVFASLMKQYDYRQPKYSLVCGHLVRHDVNRHCGCMA